MNKEELFMKKFGDETVFCLEYDKETLKDLVIKLQQENKQLNELLEKYKKELKRKTEQYEFLRHGEYVENLHKRIDKAILILNCTCVDDVNEYDKLCERFDLIEKILKGE